MIEKVIAVKGISVLEDALTGGAITLSSRTALYAENARGKSTLACIFRSLATGNGRLLVRRKTISGQTTQEVRLLVGGQIIAYSNGTWSRSLPEVIVFDSEFVDTNVYSGSRIEPGHREELLTFALGEQGVNLKRRIDVIGEEIGQLNRDLRVVETSLSANASPFSVDEFVQLSPRSNIDRLLQDAGKAVSDARNSEAIRTRPRLEVVSLPEIDLEQLQALLAETIDDVTDNAEKQVQQHIHDLLGDNERGEQWIEQGYKLMQHDSCPFCGRPDLSGTEIFRAYKSFFSVSYARLKERIEESETSVQELLSDSNLDQVLDVLTRNAGVCEKWSDMQQVVIPDPVDSDDVRVSWRELRETLTERIRKKAASPLEAVNFGEEVNLATHAHERLVSRIAEYNAAIEQADTCIAELKAELSEADLGRLSRTVQKLEAEKRRGNPLVVRGCTERTRILTEKGNKVDEKAQKREQLDQQTQSILSSYRNSVNSFLLKLGANFEIGDVRTTARGSGGHPRSEYHLEMLGERIPLTEPEQTGLCFANTLSDSDRRTLALAFFLARLENDSDLQGRIVVVDDPVSSFDSSRRSSTLRLLHDICKRCEQMILLSHDADFVRAFRDKEPVGTDVLQLSRHGNFSVLEPCSIDELCESEYYRNYYKLTGFLEDATTFALPEVTRSIRPYLEQNLRVRCPTEFGAAANLGNMISAIRNAQAPSPLVALQVALPELEYWNDFTSPFHHDASDSPVPENMTDGALRPIVRGVLVFGRGFGETT